MASCTWSDFELLCVPKGPTVTLSGRKPTGCWEFLLGVCPLPHSPQQGRLLPASVSAYCLELGKSVHKPGVEGLPQLLRGPLRTQEILLGHPARPSSAGPWDRHSAAD